MATETGHLAAIAPTARSRVTNARLSNRASTAALWADVDGRSPWARRYRDLVALIADDMGGLEGMTELKLSLIRRGAALTLECERLEARLAAGEHVDLDALGRASGHLRRIATDLGLDRVKRDKTPTLSLIADRHRKGDAPA